MSTYEICLSKNYVPGASWQKLLTEILQYLKPFESIEIYIAQRRNQINYYILTDLQLPPIVTNLPEFLFKKTSSRLPVHIKTSIPCFANVANFSESIDYFSIHYHLDIHGATISLKKLYKNSFCRIKIETEKYSYWLPFSSPANFLSIDFSKNRHLLYDKTKQALDAKGILSALNEFSSNPILSVPAYPYLQDTLFLNQISYNFDRHSLIVGASGSGKSKFISLYIRNLLSDESLKEQYQVVLIDPHDTIRMDLGAYGKIIDFVDNRVDLFFDSNINSVTLAESNFDLIKSLLDQINPILERTLRHSCFILAIGKCFSFKNLRRLLLELDFRNDLIHKLTPQLPTSITSFFLSDFNEIRTKYYSEAISPIISFIDEMETTTMFNQQPTISPLSVLLNNSSLTIFSLSHAKLGQKATTAIASLVIQQIFSLAQQRPLAKKLILIIDEIALVETPTLARYLSESRKYNIALVLSTQYLGQVSESLKNAIFANTVNYYIFRTARLDAELLSKNLSLKFLKDNVTTDQKINLFTNLSPRECIAQIAYNNKNTSAFKARTVDF